MAEKKTRAAKADTDALTAALIGRISGSLNAPDIGTEGVQTANLKAVSDAGIKSNNAVTDLGVGYLWESFNRSRAHFDLAMIDARNNANNIAATTLRTVNNGVAHDKNVEARSNDHWDYAFNATWNIDEQVWAILRLLIDLGSEQKVREALWVILLGDLGVDEQTASKVVNSVVKKAKKVKK